MPIHYYFDTHIAKTIATQLRQQGVQVTRCEEVGNATLDDLSHLVHATENALTVVSHDEDFLRLHDEWITAEKQHYGMIYVSRLLQGKRHSGRVIEDLKLISDLIDIGGASIEQDIINQLIFIT